MQYVREAFPWITAEEKSALAQLQKLIGEEQGAIGRLVDLLVERNHLYPYMGSFPIAFTNINFVSLEHLLPMLVDYEARSLGELECDLAVITDVEALSRVQDLVDMKRRHLDALRDLAKTCPETFSTVR